MKVSADVTIKQSEVLMRGQSFTAKDLLDGLILYSHDGSRHPDDAMEVMVSCFPVCHGKYCFFLHRSFLFPVQYTDSLDNTFGVPQF